MAATSAALPPRATPTATETFHLFAHLPPELRLKIWAFNLPQPRLVSVRCGGTSPSSSRCPVPGRARQPPPSLPWCTSPAPIPANLHVCHESRAEALRRYALMLGIARQPGHVYFDAARDVLFFGPCDGYMASEAQLRTLLSLADPAELARVRRVALSEALFWEGTQAARSTSSSSSSSSSSLLLPPLSPAAPASTPLHWSFSAFQLSVSAAVDVLLLLRARLPGLRELILVPRDACLVSGLAATDLVPLAVGRGRRACRVGGTAHATEHATTARLAHQVHEAVCRMALIDWSPPPWDILALERDDDSGSDRVVATDATTDTTDITDTDVNIDTHAARLPERVLPPLQPAFPRPSPCQRLPSLMAVFPRGAHGVPASLGRTHPHMQTPVQLCRRYGGK